MVMLAPGFERAPYVFRSLLSFFAIWSLAATRTAAEDWFGPPVSFPIPETATALSVGYLNDDPFVDCAVGARTGNVEKIYVLVNDGVGNMSVSAILPVTNGWNDLEVGDFNGDGRDDIAFCENPLKIYYADANHTYPGPSVSVTWPESSFFHRMEVGDLDNDGYDDLVGRYGGAWNTIYVLFGSPAGLITPPVERRVNLIEDQVGCPPELWPTSVYDIRLRDMDGDDDLDIVASCEYEYWQFCGGAPRIGIGFFENQGGQFIAEAANWIRVALGGGDNYWEQFDIAELTGNGLPDALYERHEVEIRILAGSQSVPWKDQAVVGVGDGDPHLHDLDQDERADVIKKTLYTFEIYSGGGFGAFEWVQSVPVTSGWLEFADIDGIPGPELIMICSSPMRVVVLPNLAATAATVSEESIPGAAKLELLPTVAHGGEIRVRLEGVVVEGRGGVAARVIDVSGAERATLWLRSASGGAHEGMLSTQAPWARQGVYWLDAPGSAARSKRFTIIK